jgi:hypothetical protein
MNRPTVNMWTHSDAAVARSGAIDVMVQRWQSESIEDVIEGAENPDDFEEAEE